VIVTEGLHEVIADLETKSKSIYGDTMRIFWEAADQGAAIAASAIRSRSDTVADSMSPATYGLPYRTRQGVRSVWGPTIPLGRWLATGTPRMSPNPYLDNSLNQVAPGAISALERVAGKL
jgi:hypothetical protein